MKMRQMSFSVTLLFGSLKAFVTTNFADTYTPVTVLLYNCGRATEPADDIDGLIGEMTLNLFEDTPSMPTLQRMHQIVAQHPFIQARLFLLLEQLTVTELLCGNYISIGTTVLDSLDRPPTTVYDYEDCYASDGNPGIANLMTCMMEPLEAQGRGFSHGHKKVTGVPATRVAALKNMFAAGDDELKQNMQRIRDESLRAAVTFQYVSATLLAKQLGAPSMPECFSKKQQVQSRLDGGIELDGKTVRTPLEVTAEEPQGHVVRERTLAEAEQRSCRNAYRCLPLTGCHQSMLPCYRSSAAVGRLEEYTLDEYGLMPDSAKLQSLHANWDVSKDGEVTRILNDDGVALTEEELESDAKLWSLIYTRHVRSQFGQNHNHSCTKTCTKYATDDKKVAPTRVDSGPQFVDFSFLR